MAVRFGSKRGRLSHHATMWVLTRVEREPSDRVRGEAWGASACMIWDEGCESSKLPRRPGAWCPHQRQRQRSAVARRATRAASTTALGARGRFGRQPASNFPERFRGIVSAWVCDIITQNNRSATRPVARLPDGPCVYRPSNCKNEDVQAHGERSGSPRPAVRARSARRGHACGACDSRAA